MTWNSWSESCSRHSVVALLDLAVLHHRHSSSPNLLLRQLPSSVTRSAGPAAVMATMRGFWSLSRKRSLTARRARHRRDGTRLAVVDRPDRRDRLSQHPPPRIFLVERHEARRQHRPVRDRLGADLPRLGTQRDASDVEGQRQDTRKRIGSIRLDAQDAPARRRGAFEDLEGSLRSHATSLHWPGPPGRHPDDATPTSRDPHAHAQRVPRRTLPVRARSEGSPKRSRPARRALGPPPAPRPRLVAARSRRRDRGRERDLEWTAGARSRRIRSRRSKSARNGFPTSSSCCSPTASTAIRSI